MSDIRPDPKGRYMALWPGGMNSIMHPASIADTECSYLENVVCRGGIVQTRPGYLLRGLIPGSKLQGGAIFKPKNGLPRMMIAVDGRIWVARPFYDDFELLEGVAFNADVDQIYFCPAYKSVQRNSDGSLTLVNPYPVMMMQDQRGPAAYWDGTVARHLRPEQPFLETPPGSWMVWTGVRLWLANGTRLLASDLGDPLSFSETTYIAERSNFELPGEITGMIATVDRKNLLVFTSSTTTAIKACITDRVQWAQTPDFQEVILPGIGCVSGLSCVNQYGMTMWYSRQGLVALDSALFSQQSNRFVSLDQRMMRSKRNLAPDLSGICAAGFENFFLLSVPSGDLYNAHTWVMDQNPIDSSGNAHWAGVWSGTRPVVWMSAEINGRERLFFASYGATTKDDTRIHIWEAFQSNRRDNNSRIKCQMETGMIYAVDEQRARFFEVEVVELLGDVHLKGYIGGSRGPWVKVLDTHLQAEVGSIGSSVQEVIKADTSILRAFKPQTRFVLSEQFSPQDLDQLAETDDTAGTDKGFQVLLQWTGRMGVRAIHLVTEPSPQNKKGQSHASELGQHNIVTEHGETIIE